MIDFSLNADKKAVDEIKATEQQRNMKERAAKVDYDFKNHDSKPEKTSQAEQRIRGRHRLETVADEVKEEAEMKRGETRYER